MVDLQIARGQVEALVSGSDIYEMQDRDRRSPRRALEGDLPGLRGLGRFAGGAACGRLSKNVMERFCREGDGLFPAPSEITLSCSCPDWADMCKHVAAALYGVGARLDYSPSSSSRCAASTAPNWSRRRRRPAAHEAAPSERALADDDMAALFGIDIAAPGALPLGRSREE